MHFFVTRTFASALFCIAALLTTGCSSYRAANPDRFQATPTQVAAEAWPKWDTTALEAIRDATPPFLPEYEYDADFPEADRDPRVRRLIENTGYEIHYNEIATGGLLRAYNHKHPTTKKKETDGKFSIWNSWFFPTDPNGSYLSAPGFAFDTAKAKATADISTSPSVDMTPYFAKGLQKASVQPEDFSLGGTLEIQFPEVNANSRGMLIHLPGLVWSKQENKLIDTFRRDGWSVVTVESTPWVTDPNGIQRAVVRAKRSEKVREYRQEYENLNAEQSHELLEPEERDEYTKNMKRWIDQAREDIPMPPSGFTLTPTTDPKILGASIASAVNESMATHAYAAEAAVAYMDTLDPALALKPIVVVGLSAGGLVAPTVAAGLRERYGPRVAALVVIGGGADMFAIAQSSTLSDGGIRLAPKEGKQPPSQRIEQVHATYLEAASLDSYNTAPTLQDLPVLVVSARRDSIVPHAAAKTLIERLDYPDRITTIGGHGVLFWLLPGQATRITRWLDQHTTIPSSLNPT